jgi:copper homeostasis protein
MPSPDRSPAGLARSLEVPVDSIDDALAAAPFADRLELCSDLPAEGFTPSLQLVRSVRRETGCLVVALLRPRTVAAASDPRSAASFHLDDAHLREAVVAIARLAEAGAHGVALGALDAAGQLDAGAMEALVAAAGRAGLEACVHRCIDLVPDRAAAFARLERLGVRRVLTAGVRGYDAAATALTARVACLRLDRALLEAGRSDGAWPIDLVACGGVDAGIAPSLLGATGHLHASGRVDGRLDPARLAALRAAISGTGAG